MKRKQRHEYQSTTSIITERRTPTRRAEVTASVKVPLLQAAINGLCGVAIATILADLRAGIVAGVIVFTLSWAFLLRYHLSLLWAIEFVFNTDINHDGKIGNPPPTSTPRDPGWLTINGNRARRAATQTMAEEKREAVLRLVEVVWARQESGRPAGQRELRGYDLRHGWKVTDGLHKDVGAQLIQSGLAHRRGKGWVLTATPEEVADAIKAW